MESQSQTWLSDWTELNCLAEALLWPWTWVSFFGGIQHSPVDDCSLASCNFGVLNRRKWAHVLLLCHLESKNPFVYTHIYIHKLIHICIHRHIYIYTQVCIYIYRLIYVTTHYRTLAWSIPWTEEPGGLQSTGLQSQSRLSGWHIHAHIYRLPRWP